MLSRVRVRSPGVVLCGLVGILVIACTTVFLRPAAIGNEAARDRQLNEVLPQIETLPVSRGQIMWLQNLRGQVRVDGTVEVGSEISGRILEVLVDEGDTIEEGQLLARMDPEIYLTRRRQAEAQLEAAVARYDVANLQLEQAASALIARERLSGRGIVAEEELRQLRLEVEIREANLACPIKVVHRLS